MRVTPPPTIVFAEGWHSVSRLRWRGQLLTWINIGNLCSLAVRFKIRKGHPRGLLLSPFTAGVGLAQFGVQT